MDNIPVNELNSTIEALRQDLLSWTVDGHHPVRSVFYREDVYSGQMTHKSPELILELNLRDGYTYTLLPSVRAEDNQTWRRFTPEEYQGGKGLGMNGSHRQFGVLILSGDIICPQVIEVSMVILLQHFFIYLENPFHLTWRVKHSTC